MESAFSKSNPKRRSSRRAPFFIHLCRWQTLGSFGEAAFQGVQNTALVTFDLKKVIFSQVADHVDQGSLSKDRIAGDRPTGAFKNESQTRGGEVLRWQIAADENEYSAAEKQSRVEADATPRRPVAIRKSAERDNFNLVSGVDRDGIPGQRKAKTKAGTSDIGTKAAPDDTEPLEQKI